MSVCIYIHIYISLYKYIYIYIRSVWLYILPTIFYVPVLFPRAGMQTPFVSHGDGPVFQQWPTLVHQHDAFPCSSVLIQRTKFIVALNYGKFVIWPRLASELPLPKMPREQKSAPQFAQLTTCDIVSGVPSQESMLKSRCGSPSISWPQIVLEFWPCASLRRCCQVSILCLGFLEAALT